MAFDTDRLKDGVDLAAVVGSYVALKKKGREFTGLCPFHADSNPSFYVVPHKQMCHCFSCGWSGDVIKFVQEIEGVDFKQACEKLGATDQWQPRTDATPARNPTPERVTSTPPPDAREPDMTIGTLGAPSATWAYRDADGRLLGYVARYATPEGKEIRCWTWGKRGEGKPGWGCGHWNSPRPLYGLDRLADRTDAPVLLVEGEKTADAAQALLPSYVAITWPGGAQALTRASWEPLRGRKILIWPDADEPGKQAAARLAGILADPKGLNCTVKVINPDGQPEGWDLADAELDGWDTPAVIAWAKPRAEPYKPIQAAPEPASAPVAAPEVSEPQPAAEPAKTQQKRPKQRPRLAAVDGNAALAPDPEAEHAPAAMSEDHVADEFAARQADDLRYVAGRNMWLVWEGSYWKPDARKEVNRRVVEHCRAALYWPEAMQMTPDYRRKLGSLRFAGAVRDLSQSDRRIAAEWSEFERDPFLLGVPGGVVDLQTGKLIEPEREHYILRQTAVAPAPGRPENWLRFIGHICKGDSSLVDYVQRWCGYLISGDGSEECLLFCFGPTQRGKSKFVNAMREMLGGYAVTANMETFTESKVDRHSEELATLAGARMIVASETEAGRRWNESRIKALTGRDMIRARMLHENSFEFQLGKIVIAGNHAPQLRNVDDTFRRRLHILEFSNPVPEDQVDRHLDDKLRAEYPQILQWCIDGFLAWRDYGLGKPEAITSAVDEYLQAEDTLGEWLEECCERGPALKSTTAELYLSYKRWTEQAGEHAKSQKNFVNQLVSRGFDRTRTAESRGIAGIKPKDRPSSVPTWHQD